MYKSFNNKHKIHKDANTNEQINETNMTLVTKSILVVDSKCLYPPIYSINEFKSNIIPEKHGQPILINRWIYS